MKLILISILIAAIFASCRPKQKEHIDNKKVNINNSDTTIIKKNIIGEIAGSAYMKRATGYSAVASRDTSDFMIIFSEGKDEGKVSISIHYDKYNRSGKLFRTRLEEFRRVLQVAKTEYDFDSLTIIDIGRLVSTGDLAVQISNDYFSKLGKEYHITDYRKISDFLLESKLAQDFNELFKPYYCQVQRIEVEKVFFTTKNDLFYSSLVEADSSEVPDRILDCMTWLLMGAKK